MTFVFWTVILLLLGGALYCWREERRVRTGTTRLLEEVEAYLTKRFGGGPRE